MKANTKVASTALVVLSVSALSATVFHNHLTKSAPAADEVVAKAPSQVRLWFSERPEVAFSSVTLQGADSAKIPVAKMHPTDDTLSVASDLVAPLKDGKYSVTWRTASKDGHAVKGKYNFTVGK